MSQRLSRLVKAFFLTLVAIAALGLGVGKTLATAPSPPQLVPAILNGKPISVLYVTRSEDTVLVRCYPGYAPSLEVRAMGANPSQGGQQEGVLTCVAAPDA